MATVLPSVDKTQLVSLAVGLTLWGCSLPMFGVTIYILLRRYTFSYVNWINIIVACLLFIFSTTRMIVHSKVILESTVRVSFPDTPTASFKSIHDERLVATITYGLQMMLGDAVVIYRCYMLWQSLRVVAVPVLLWCGTFVAFIGTTYYSAALSLDLRTLFVSPAGRWRTAFFSLMLLTNLISTGLLAFRIRAINKQIPRSTTSVMKSTIYPIMQIVIDAGIIYSALLLISVITLALKSSFTFAMADIIVPTVSIIFYLVIMRIAVAKSSLRSTTAATTRSSANASHTGRSTTGITAMFSTRNLSEPHFPMDEYDGPNANPSLDRHV